MVLSTGGGISGGSALWSPGFMPGKHAGVRFRNSGDPILNVSRPAGVDAELQRDSLDLIGALNRRRLEVEPDPEIATRIASYEMAYRLQSSAPELMDLKSESPETLKLYGADPAKPSFARACLLARRMIERGVRCVNIYHSGWDAHSNVAGNITNNTRATDQGSAALVQDLKQRGLLDETLVVWGGEFGRQPTAEYREGTGRDHNSWGFTMWMAGGGIKGGVSIGETDELGSQAVKDRFHVRRLHATILNQLGLDPNNLSYFHGGLDKSLVGVEGAEPIHQIIA